MTPADRSWVLQTANEALEAKHIFPCMAACEAALESAFGNSALAKEAHNLFGLKAHKSLTGTFNTVSLPTKEFLGGNWMEVSAEWMKYDTLADCFADRMATLMRLRDVYPHYRAALTASGPEIYISEVSKTWSTDPNRAEKCLAIYREIFPEPEANNIQLETT